MAVAYGSKRIMPVAINDDSVRDDSILNDEHFAHTGRFLVIADKPIPKNSKVYMEITVTNLTIEKDIRHIPIYVGIHKEPSYGILANDFCLGNVFYTKAQYLNALSLDYYISFNIMERFASLLNMEYQFVKDVTSKVPIINTVIGIGVDMIQGVINIYTDGKLFYSFKPVQFNINDQPNGIFFAMYMAESTETIEGDFNLGRCGLKYTPPGYLSLYEEYFYKMESSASFPCRIQINSMYGNLGSYGIPGKLNIQNEVAPVVNNHRDIWIEKSSTKMDFYTDSAHTIKNPRAFEYHNPSTNVGASNEKAWICYPIPLHQKVYFEFSSREGELIPKHEGIPLRVGLTSDPNNIKKNTYLVDLFHEIHIPYKLHMYSTDNYYEYANSYLLTPNMPAQPEYVGVMIDLENNTFTLYNNSIPICVLPCLPYLNNFAVEGIDNLTWFMFEVPTAYLVNGDIGHVICNFGEEQFKYSNIADNVNIMSLYYYYNYTLKSPSLFEWPCTIKVVPEFLRINKYIDSFITVGDPDEDIWSPGLNKMWATYNKVGPYGDDMIEMRNAPKISPFDLVKLMEAHKSTNKK